MTYPFRLLKTGYRSGYYNMGLDSGLLESVVQESAAPVLRLYGWEPAAVSVGCFQGLTDAVDLDACRRRGVDVLRRVSGGGAVFHHAELTYSIVMPITHPLAAGTIQESYKRFCGGVICGLEALGVSAVFAPVNDILAEGRKVSGNAQTRRGGGILHHGTVLLDLDYDRMLELLKVPRSALPGKRAAGLKALLGRSVSYEEAESALADGFRRALSLEFSAYPAAPTAAEAARADELAYRVFGSPEWLYKT